jgi:uncharacterized SAM-binding protein YcdF (DUF218 family)
MVADDEPRSAGRFRLFVAALRLLFDLLLLAVVLLIIGFLLFAGSLEREHRDPQRSADGIAVLTGGVSRIDEAMKLLARHKAKRLLITGVNRTTTTEELKQLSSQGDQYFSCCVDIDYEARNTIDNATETSQWVAKNHYTSVIVVTSNYHMPRALAELERVMPEVTLIPYAVVDNNVHLDHWWTYSGTTRLLFSEYVKYLLALGRLGATHFVGKVFLGGAPNATEDASEP